MRLPVIRQSQSIEKILVPVKLNILLSIAAIHMAVVGLGLIFAPQAFGVGAVPADASAALIAYLRLWGSPFLGIAVLNWMARNAIILGNIVGGGRDADARRPDDVDGVDADARTEAIRLTAWR